MPYPYRGDQGRVIPPDELEAYLNQFAWVDERAWLKEDDEASFYGLMFQFKWNCEHAGRPVPVWLQETCDLAPPEDELVPPVEFG